MARLRLSALALVATGPAAWAEAPAVRVGDHPGFGRIVYEFAASPGGTAPGYTVAERPGLVVLTFPGVQGVPDAVHPPRNVLSATGGDDRASIRLAPGARWRAKALGSRVVVDILDPATPRPATERPATERPAAARQVLVPPPPAGAHAGPPAIVPVLATTAPVVPVAHEDLPHPAPPAAADHAAPGPAPEATHPPAEAVHPAAPDPPAAAGPRAEPGGTVATLAGHDLLLPFPPGTGAAALVENGTALLVFDDRRPIDLSAVRTDPVWGGAVVQLLPDATVIRVRDAPPWISLHAAAGGWAVSPTAPPEDGMVDPVLSEAGLLLPGHAPGRVVVVPAGRGRRLLVGTWRAPEPAGHAPGDHAPVDHAPVDGGTAARRMPEFTLLATALGVAVDPVSDRIGVSARADGFLVTAGGVPLAASAVERTAPGGRLFELPAGAPDVLMARLQGQISAAARGGTLGRTADRLSAAQTMVALGLGAEAQSLLRAAAIADPEAAGGELMAALGAASAILTGRPGEAGALDDPRFAGNGEAALWRGLRDAMRDPASPRAATAFAGAARLVDTYPETLRRRLLPRMAETTALGGQGEAADALLAGTRVDDPAFDLARAIRRGAGEDLDAALAGFATVVAGHDLRQRARAMVLGTELALARGRMDPPAAAAAMDRAAAAWRNGTAERDARLRAAGLRTVAGAWRPALDGLRETAGLFPDDRALVRERMSGVFAAMLDRTPPVAPLELVALAGEFPDVLPEGERGAALADRLADALTALDLPGRAGPVLARLMDRASGPARAVLGRRLAAVRLDDADPAGALAALAGSEVPDLPPAMTEARALLRARAQAATDLGAAAATLSALGTAAADDLRATLLAAAGDWNGARAALMDLLARTPAADAVPVVLRLATAAARLDDPAARQTLRAQWGGKLPPGRDADLFRLLTAEPVREPADLPRAAREIALARSVPR